LAGCVPRPAVLGPYLYQLVKDHRRFNLCANTLAFLHLLLVRTLQDQRLIKVTISIHTMSSQGALTPLVKDVNPQAVLVRIEDLQ